MQPPSPGRMSAEQRRSISGSGAASSLSRGLRPGREERAVFIESADGYSGRYIQARAGQRDPCTSRPAATGLRRKAGHDLIIDVRRGRRRSRSATARASSSAPIPPRCTCARARAACRRSSDDDKEDIRKTIDKDVLKKKASAFSRRASRGGDGLKVSGDLEMGGKTKPVTFDLSESDGTLDGQRGRQADRLGHQALLGAVRRPEGQRRGQGRRRGQARLSRRAARR